MQLRFLKVETLLQPMKKADVATQIKDDGITAMSLNPKEF